MRILLRPVSSSLHSRSRTTNSILEFDSRLRESNSQGSLFHPATGQLLDGFFRQRAGLDRDETLNLPHLRVIRGEIAISVPNSANPCWNSCCSRPYSAPRTSDAAQRRHDAMPGHGVVPHLTGPPSIQFSRPASVDFQRPADPGSGPAVGHRRVSGSPQRQGHFDLG